MTQQCTLWLKQIIAEHSLLNVSNMEKIIDDGQSSIFLIRYGGKAEQLRTNGRSWAYPPNAGGL